jgi:membrane-associated phospholipid phosphatase
MYCKSNFFKDLFTCDIMMRKHLKLCKKVFAEVIELNEERYAKISNWFHDNKKRMKILNILYKGLPTVTMVEYAVLVIFEIFQGKDKMEEIIRVIIVPLITFGICTAARKVVNEKRPYEAMNITPLIKKDKKGQSFPSRHVLSATIIAMASMYVNVQLGIIMMLISVAIAVIRPVAGVHYIRDVIGGLVMGIVCGVMGFYVF